MKLDRKINPDKLQEEVRARLGRDDVFITSRQPGQYDHEGNELEGVLLITDGEGQEVELDPAVAAAILRDHDHGVDPTPEPAPGAGMDKEVLLSRVEEAKTIADLRTVLMEVIEQI